MQQDHWFTTAQARLDKCVWAVLQRSVEGSTNPSARRVAQRYPGRWQEQSDVARQESADEGIARESLGIAFNGDRNQKDEYDRLKSHQITMSRGRLTDRA